MALLTRGGLLVPHGDCHPRQDDWQGVTLRRRFLPSTTNSARSVVSAYSAAAVTTRGAGRSSTAKKNLLLQHSACAQPRFFCRLDAGYWKKRVEVGPGLGLDVFAAARNSLKPTQRDQRLMLEGLRALKTFAGIKDYYGDEHKATLLLSAAVSPLALWGGKHGGGSNLDLDDDVVKQSLAVTYRLLKNAPAKIRNKLCSEILVKGVKTSLERIRDRGSRSELGKLANEILAKLPSTPH